MKTSPFSLFGGNHVLILVNALLTIGLTVISFRYVQPKNCYRLCGAEDNKSPCPSGSCNFGEQKAGWPMPAFVDDPGGGSPTGGWGLLGPEDPPLLMPIIIDVLFYSLLLWSVVYMFRLIRSQTLSLKSILATLPLNFFLAICLWIFYLFFAYYVPIGRGHSEQVYVNTPTSTATSLTFSPIVSIPLDELIETYGEPDYVRFIRDGTTETPIMRMVLGWDSEGIFVELPQIANKTYALKKGTNIKRIIFFNEGQAIAIEGKPLEEEKIFWKGYRNYMP